MQIKRGKFIVLEGLDRSGKSSVVRAIQHYLTQVRGETTVLMNFPDRGTQIGKMISNYLQNTTQISNEAIHLLFSANRWQKVKHIEEALTKGVNIVCDRYWFSGVAYSCAKGMDYEWCISPDRGLIKPDLIVFLDADPDVLKARPGYGEQKYERVDFQKNVSSAFKRIFSEEKNLNVRSLDVGSLTLKQVQKEAIKIVQLWLN